MKKTILLISLLVFGTGLKAQTSEFDQLYSAFKGEEGVVNVFVPGVLIRLAGNIADLEKEEKELLRSIKSIKIMVIDNSEINNQVNLVKVFSRIEPDEGVIPLLRINDGDDDVLILAREKGERISELYVVVGGDENVMIRINGRMERDLMKSIYKVTGIEQTKYARRI